ncbi:GNAT family N-acetyltransferase [Pseudogracilibacillus sp. SE30717A]|uniref:GNAT family N-acetyltransferase n=1 Tax=Pseudogracilibacillus sp. SE30717A TaxID=3098293 RepID=UPI00300E5517
MKGNHIEIRVLSTMEELAEVQKVEIAVWNMEPVPLHQTFTALQNGGILLGAFDGEKLIGFLYSFAGFNEGTAYLCSHMLGILPEYQTSGIGEKMKIKQAELARKLGYRMITWTFDPLESRNAYLNLHKLRATGAIYDANHYGIMNDGLNQGLPSDRIQIKWFINEEKRNSTHHFDNQKLLLDADGSSVPVLTEFFKRAEWNSAEVLFVAIPKNFQELKQMNLELAKKWRMETRFVFQELFEEGFQATDLLLDNDRSLSYYVFTR